MDLENGEWRGREDWRMDLENGKWWEREGDWDKKKRSFVGCALVVLIANI